jgi:large subunit ribosomal protein L19
MTHIKTIALQKKQTRTDLPQLKSGMKVKVWYKIKEKDKTRTTFFEGIIIAIKHGQKTTNSMFTVRKIAVDNVGVNMTWPLHSPVIEKIDIIQTAKTRRNKLYYLRQKSKKQVRTKLRKHAAFKELVVEEKTEPEKTPEPEKAE